MQHLLTQNKQLLNHVQELTSQLQKIQQQSQHQQTEETDGQQNTNSNNNNSDAYNVSSSSSSSKSTSVSPDVVDQKEDTANHQSSNPSPQAVNPLFEYPSDEINLNSSAVPGDPFLVDPFSSSNGVSVEMDGGDSS